MPIFSFPGEEGIGTFGKTAYEFVDYIYDANVRLWQILPLHPLTFGNSPYQSTSTYAGNVYLIDLNFLYNDGLLEKKDIISIGKIKNENRVDYDFVFNYKKVLLLKAAKNFYHNSDKRDYEDFSKECAYFLDEYAIFTLLKDRYNGIEYSGWDKIHRLHYDDVINEFKKQNPYELELYKIIQYLFFKQWFKLKEYANKKNIKIIGDMPIYSSLDSVEVFSDYKNFLLDENRRPLNVAGCPPDAFSSEGQLWRNPLYDYNFMKNDNYKYLINRISHLLKLYDVIRFDHFRGFASYYSIPASANTAKMGKWEIGPGIEFFNILKNTLGNVEIIAEDLGIIDDHVQNLLKATSFPGMKVVEFAFGGDAEHHKYLPKNYEENTVAYLGTHDNDTFVGWLNKASEIEKKQAIDLLNLDIDIKDINDENTIRDKKCHLDAIKELFSSKANTVVVLMQDLLGLGTEARINTPSTVGEHNWSYRFKKDYLDINVKNYLKSLIRETNRN